MLVLSRKVGESIVVPGCGLTITVQQVRGGRVRLGVSAPHEVAVHRQEVWQQLQGWEGISNPVEEIHERQSVVRTL